MATPKREGSLEAPTRHALDWKNPEFYNEDAVLHEMERVFDLCHGCRRCVSLCNSFPTLFDLVDESSTMEVDGVDKKDYWKVVDHCYLCDLCYMTKCPYIPPHEWNIDFPHLMLRAKAVKFKKGDTKFRDKVLSSTDRVGKLAGIPVVVDVVNKMNQNPTFRKQLDKVLGVHPDAKIPSYHSHTGRDRVTRNKTLDESKAVAAGRTTGKVAIFATCYGNYNEPHIVDDLRKVFEINGIPVTLLDKEQCCGMPKLELGDLESVAAAKDVNVPAMMKLINDGWDIVGPVPSCVLMFKQELPLMFPDDADVQTVKGRIFDPFEYLMLRHKEGKLNTSFKKPLGKVSYHTACHLRVQNIGYKTRELLELIPDTKLELLERCSGHDGTYAVKSEFHDISMKICRPIFTKVNQAKPDYYGSDCPMAGHQIENGLEEGMPEPTHPLTMLRIAYGL
ncbi:heterodisulfide reductase-related iron-sulfur binding cluster [Thiothrix lacustris]|jgi:Fe-S oxidoreductase|uniref:heterodisulfide reductase-related iron-sulfur binding cluster n=1 Tax=Thiothrix lacustris TaxID=525917 RepID=UPI00048E8565|nr:heterodisulfide reductase-related iron-sulfur binding cluster [Thiothrix lacustris]WMP16000.1 heterodisulfide reductase-related iron-sulfur binding cluster [Thiothrix lacustris]